MKIKLYRPIFQLKEGVEQKEDFLPFRSYGDWRKEKGNKSDDDYWILGTDPSSQDYTIIGWETKDFEINGG